jgi:DNA-binding MurR/RpiR family transcriptional regulator
MEQNGCYVKMKNTLDALPPTERRIASYILDDPESVIGMPIDLLATKCATSKASVVRLCKSLGYRGYKQFCIELASDLAVNSHIKYKYDDVHPGDDLRSIVESVCHNNIRTLQESMAVMDLASLEKAVQAITAAPRVDFYGLGTSGIVAHDAQNKFLRINKISFASADPHLQILSASSLRPGDVAVLISYSGETRDIFDTLAVVRESGATTVSITRYGPNKLSRQVDISLYTSSQESFIRSGAMSSRIGQLNVIDMLYTAVVSNEYETVKEHLDRTLRSSRSKHG